MAFLLHLQHDFHYEYTECDSNGGRWRVSVPKPNVCIGGAPNSPVRGKGCGKLQAFTVFYNINVFLVSADLYKRMHT